jgi:hypothetical protein
MIMRYHSVKQIASLCVLGAALAWPSVGRAQYNYQLETPDPNLPPLAGQYVSPDQWHAYYGMGIYIKDVIHWGFTQSFPPPPPGSPASHTFGSRLDGQASFDGGITYFPLWATGPVTVGIQWASQGTGSGFSYNDYNTEMLALDMSGGSLPAGVMLRESPTLASLGQTRVCDYGGGRYCVSSFFDIYTELSLDGGQTWMPDQDGRVHMELIPEPSTLMLAGFGLLGLLTYVRRCRE